MTKESELRAERDALQKNNEALLAQIKDTWEKVCAAMGIPITVYSCLQDLCVGIETMRRERDYYRRDHDAK